jgi:hypothetical protein
MRRVLNLGAGVQSTTVALLAAQGVIDPFDIAVFADTGWEPTQVYSHLDWLESAVPFPVERVSVGNLRDDLLAAARGERRISNPPFFVKTTSADGARFEPGIIRRGCTRDYKIVPIERFLRKWRNGQQIEQSFGISIDEVERMRSSRHAWSTYAYPLIDLGMTRADCLAWINERGYPQPPRSACAGCPYHSNAEWRRLRDEQPEAWADAVEVDAAIRNGLPGVRGDVYMHRSLVPLPDVDLTTPEDHGQLSWSSECEGMCGV